MLDDKRMEIDGSRWKRMEVEQEAEQQQQPSVRTGCSRASSSRP